MDEIRRLAEPLAGKRVLHLSATAFGGGVAEINYTLVPLMVDAGLDVEVLEFLLPWLRGYDASVFHMREYVPTADGLGLVAIWPPAIDPLQPKNMALSPEDAAYIVDQFGVDVDRPLLTQVSRFDPW